MKKKTALSLGACALVSSTMITQAEVISFDEFAPTNGVGLGLSEEYSGLGVHFASVFNHTWAGASNGNPSGYGVDGTNGPQFLSVELSTVEIIFDTAITDFQLDVVQAGFPGFSDSFNMVGYNGASIVDTSFESFSFGDSWRTASLEGEINRITFSGFGTAFVAYAVDNLQWTVPTPSSLGMVAAGGLVLVRRKR